MSALAPPAIPARAVRTLRARKNVERLTPPQLASLRQAFREVYRISDERGYAFHAGIHGLPLPAYCTHGSDLFLPWHRAYLYFFELALRDRVPDATLPWWDWSSPSSRQNGIPRAYTARRDNGAANPLQSAAVPPAARTGGQPTRTSRNPSAPAMLPTAETVEWILNRGDFLDFQSQLENIHGSIHVWVGGTMGSVARAAYDPIFWAHHSMVDRLWRIWQARHTNSGPPRSILNAALPPFDMTVADTLDVRALGYDYAASTRSVPGRGPA
jgi:tyrosinase